MVKSDYLVTISLFLGVLLGQLGYIKILMRSNLKKNYFGTPKLCFWPLTPPPPDVVYNLFLAPCKYQLNIIKYIMHLYYRLSIRDILI